MKQTYADKQMAVAWLNEILGKPMADTWGSGASEGVITFDIRPEWFPEIANLRCYVQAKLSERLGTPVRDRGTQTEWHLSPTRTVTLWTRHMRPGVSITLMDTGEADA